VDTSKPIKNEGNQRNGIPMESRQSLSSVMSDEEQLLFSIKPLTLTNIMNIYPIARTVLSYLPLSQTVLCSTVCLSWNSVAIRFYGNTKVLDLSEFYGVIGSPEFDEKNFFVTFLPRFHAVAELTLRYCTHLKAAHLDRMLAALTPTSDEEQKNELDKNKNKKKEAQNGLTRPNKNLSMINLYFCSRLGSNSLWKIQARAPNLQELNIGRCHAMTANKDINGLKALVKLPLRKMTISLDPSIDKEKAMEVVSLLIHEDSFRELRELDLSHGCEILGELDLSDLHDERNMKVIKPKPAQRQDRLSADAGTDDDTEY